jgi:hypothetical protein
MSARTGLPVADGPTEPTRPVPTPGPGPQGPEEPPDENLPALLVDSDDSEGPSTKGDGPGGPEEGPDNGHEVDGGARPAGPEPGPDNGTADD